jgi:hypothetical protein
VQLEPHAGASIVCVHPRTHAQASVRLTISECRRRAPRSIVDIPDANLGRKGSAQEPADVLIWCIEPCSFKGPSRGRLVTWGSCHRLQDGAVGRHWPVEEARADPENRTARAARTLRPPLFLRLHLLQALGTTTGHGHGPFNTVQPEPKLEVGCSIALAALTRKWQEVGGCQSGHEKLCVGKPHRCSPLIPGRT